MIDTTGHKRFFNDELFRLPVHIIGCGGVGSHVATGLIRMGVGHSLSPLHLYDDDSYEYHNLANQAITVGEIGEYKVDALHKKLLRINHESVVRTHSLEVRGESGLDFDGVVFLCLDTMEARADIVEHLLENNPFVDCVIETRMDAEVGMSHCFDPNNTKHQDRWWELLYPDEETEDVAGCGGPQSIVSAIYGTTMIALKQFEWFARRGTAHNIKNRIYIDFEYPTSAQEEVWPT